MLLASRYRFIGIASPSPLWSSSSPSMVASDAVPSESYVVVTFGSGANSPRTLTMSTRSQCNVCVVGGGGESQAPPKSSEFYSESARRWTLKFIARRRGVYRKLHIPHNTRRVGGTKLQG